MCNFYLSPRPAHYMCVSATRLWETTIRPQIRLVTAFFRAPLCFPKLAHNSSVRVAESLDVGIFISESLWTRRVDKFCIKIIIYSEYENYTYANDNGAWLVTTLVNEFLVRSVIIVMNHDNLAVRMFQFILGKRIHHLHFIYFTITIERQLVLSYAQPSSLSLFLSLTAKVCHSNNIGVRIHIRRWMTSHFVSYRLGAGKTCLARYRYAASKRTESQ